MMIAKAENMPQKVSFSLMTLAGTIHVDATVVERSGIDRLDLVATWESGGVLSQEELREAVSEELLAREIKLAWQRSVAPPATTSKESLASSEEIREAFKSVEKALSQKHRDRLGLSLQRVWRALEALAAVRGAELKGS